MRYSEPKKINTENIEKEKRQFGIYILLNRYKNPIYIGTSTQLKHRLKAILYGRSDYAQIKEKKELREEAFYYKRAYTSEAKGRKIENRRKENLKYNEL